MLTRIVCIVSTVMLCGWSWNWRIDPVTQAINNKFPPLNIEQQRKVAIDSAADALSRIPNPNIAFLLHLPDAERAIASSSLKKQGVVKISLSGERQLLKILIDFKRTFSETDSTGSIEADKWLRLAKPETIGKLEVYAGLAATFETGAKSEVRLKIIPVLSRITIERVTLAQRIDATRGGQFVADLLNRFKDNITGELSEQEFTKLHIPVLSNAPIDISKALLFSSPGTKAAVKIDAKPIAIPVKATGAAWLIDDRTITVLVQLTELVGTPGTVPVDKTFEAIGGQVVGLLRNSFGLDGSRGVTQVAIRKELAALTVNSSVRQAEVCFTGSGETSQKVESKIPMPDASSINCASTRDCNSNRTCSFNAQQDGRNCNTCLLHAPRICVGGSIFGPGGCTGGQCVQRGDDPVCATARGAQQLIYDADANLKKADCDRLREMETAGCKVEEVAKKVICEAGKTALSALKKTGNFGNLDVSSKLSSEGLRVCLQDFNLSAGLDRVALTLELTGNAKADVDVKFTPLDIVGHLTCQFPWQKQETFSASVREPRITLTSAIALERNQSTARMKFATEQTTIKARLSPGPTEFLLKSPNMVIACPAAGAILPFTVGLTPFIKELRGDIDLNVGRQNAVLEIPTPKASIGDLKLTGEVGETSQAITLAVK